MSVAGVGVPVMTHLAWALSAQAMDSFAVIVEAPPSWCPSSSTTLCQCTRSMGESLLVNSDDRRLTGMMTRSQRLASVWGDRP